LVALFFLPESIKYLSLRPERREDLVKLLWRIAPQTGIPAHARFVLSDESNGAQFAFRDLLAGRLAVVTPLYWAANVVSLVVFFFVNQWTPVLLTSAGMPVERAAMGTTLLMLGGFVGALATMRPVDRFGFMPVPILFAVGIPAVGLIGVPGLAEAWVMALVFLAGFCLVGLQFGIVATETQVFPTYIRSWGVGSCFAFGRVGSVIGPMLGGALLAGGSKVEDLFAVAAALLAIGLAVSVALAAGYRMRMREMAGAVPGATRPAGAPAAH
jgi:AAHS family 4-hydroxybenzoate transporter-like MFS transporter